MHDIVLQKIQLRKILSQKRDVLKKNTLIDFNLLAFNDLKKIVNFEEINCVASYLPIRSEISTHKLNNVIIDMKKILSLPTIQKDNNELVFKKYNYKQKLQLGRFNIPEPLISNEEVLPQLFFVPCLGFDLNGYRLGYGGGFYDKTFSKLINANHKFYAIGYAFDGQKQNQIPIENFDYKLDFVLTEKQLYTFL